MTTTSQLRRCIGSTKFGIEAHEASADQFPAQPSQKDGLGRMCRPHWNQYTGALRQAAKAREAGADVEVHDAASKATSKRARRASPMAHVPAKRPRKARANADAMAQAEALIAEVDALPADEMVQRVGDDDVQAALELVGIGRTETPISETIAGGTDETDAA